MQYYVITGRAFIAQHLNGRWSDLVELAPDTQTAIPLQVVSFKVQGVGA